MRIYKWIYNRPTFKTKYTEICRDIKLEPPDQKILKANVRYITKIMYDKDVDQICDMMHINKRIGTKIYLKQPHKISSKASLVRHISLYNALPLDLKLLNPQQNKQKLKNSMSLSKIELTTYPFCDSPS